MWESTGGSFTDHWGVLYPYANRQYSNSAYCEGLQRDRPLTGKGYFPMGVHFPTGGGGARWSSLD